MSEERTYIVVVDADQPDKRQQLSHGLDFAICFNNGRITAGEYEITVKRLTLNSADRNLLRNTLAEPDRLYKFVPKVALRAEARGWITHEPTLNGCYKLTLTDEGKKRAEQLAKE